MLSGTERKPANQLNMDPVVRECQKRRVKQILRPETGGRDLNEVPALK